MKRIERLAAEGAEAVLRGRVRPRRSVLARCAFGFVSICLLMVLVGGAGFVLLRGGVNSDLLRDEAQKSLTQILGEGASAAIGSVALSLDAAGHVALEARDVSISDPRRSLELKGVRSVRLGLAPLPLLAGRIRVAQLEVEGVSFDMPESKGDFWRALPHDARGFVDFDAVSGELFAAMRRSLDLLTAQNTHSIAILDSELRFRTGDAVQNLRIDRLRLSEQSASRIGISGAVGWKGDTIAVEGGVDRKPGADDLDGFKLAIAGVPVRLGSPPDVSPVIANRVNPAHFELNGKALVTLEGEAADTDEPQRLTAGLNVTGVDMELGKVEGVRGDLTLGLEHVVGSGKIEVKGSRLRLGGLDASFNGAFGPEPGSESAAEGPAYRFEILTSKAVSAPAESTEQPLSFATRISGRFLPEQKRVQFANLDVQTEKGVLYGQGGMGFGAGSPEMIFMLRIPEMPVADAKNLWPIDVADGAREWVLKNMYGGDLKDSHIDISLAGGRFNGPGLPPPLTGDEIKADFNVADTRFDVVGELPPVRDADGAVTVRGAHATIKLAKGVAYTANNRQVDVSDGTLVIPWGPQRPVIADLDISVDGKAAAIAEIAGNKPIDVLKNVPFTPEDVNGDVKSRVHVSFAVSKGAPPGTLKWTADIGFADLDVTKPVAGSIITGAVGDIKVDQAAAVITADARLDGVPAKISMTEPVDLKGPVRREQKIRLDIDDKTRDAVMPGLGALFSGPIAVDLTMAEGGRRKVTADLGKTQIDLSWLGWRKGAGVPAKATFDLIQAPDKSRIDIRDLAFTGDAFGARGDLAIVKGDLQSADLREVRLNRSDNLSIKATRTGGTYRVSVRGSEFDARSLIKQVSDRNEKKGGGKGGSGPRVVVSAQIDEVGGFNNESLRNVAVSYESAGAKISGVSVNAVTGSGAAFVATNNEQAGARSISLQSNDAGAVLRFFDFYDKMRGGRITVGLAAQGDSPLRGQIDARNFSIVNEPRLAKIVSTPSGSSGTSLNQAVKRNIDVSRVDVERGFSLIEKGDGYLTLTKGVVRSPTVGTTFQGTLYDRAGNMSITGTFMPAYGINRIFGEVPIFGALLGNGRDRGLLGITYKLVGNAKQPQVIVNPISIIAPGIFRSIFEF